MIGSGNILKIVLPVTLIFFIISAIGIYNHELWLDEAQHFLIGRDSDSVTSMYYNMQYDGHVRLWNYCLFFITHYISATPFAMQTFHLMIITATVFIFLRLKINYFKMCFYKERYPNPGGKSNRVIHQNDGLFE